MRLKHLPYPFQLLRSPFGKEAGPRLLEQDVGIKLNLVGDERCRTERPLGTCGPEKRKINKRKDRMNLRNLPLLMKDELKMMTMKVSRLMRSLRSHKMSSAGSRVKFTTKVSQVRDHRHGQLHVLYHCGGQSLKVLGHWEC